MKNWTDDDDDDDDDILTNRCWCYSAFFIKICLKLNSNNNQAGDRDKAKYAWHYQHI